MIRLAALALAFVAHPATAQVVSTTYLSPVDTTARNAAAEAKAAADAAQAAIPVPATSIPTMEVVGGAAGTTNTFRRGDAVQPRISRTISGTTASTGQASVTWPAMPSVPKLTVTPYVATTATTLPPSCYPVAGTITPTGATIKCYVDQTILGLGLVPRANAAAGVTFDVLVLPGS